MNRIFTYRCLFAAVVLVTVASFFILNYFTPYLADDYANLSRTVWGTQEPLTGFGSFIRSMRNFYLSWGGRVEGFLFTAMLLYLPPVLADVLNTLCYMAVTLLLYLICRGNRKNNLPLYLGVHILLWISVPDYGQVMFWSCGSANYLWPSLFVLALLWMYRSYGLSEGWLFSRKILCVPAFVLGFLGGFAMENMSAGMLVISTLYFAYFYKYHYKIQLPVAAAYLGSLLGFAFLVLAPGNRVRSGAEPDLPVLFKFFVISYYWFCFIGVLCIMWAVFYRAARQIVPKTYRQAACESLLYVCGAAASAYCMLAAPTSPERTWYIVCVYAVISVGMLYSLLEQHCSNAVKKNAVVITTGAAVLVAVSIADTMLSSFEIFVQLREREVYILEQKSLGNLDIYTPSVSHQYPLRAKHDALTGLSDITSNPEFWINKAAAQYYGVNSITGIEEK